MTASIARIRARVRGKKLSGYETPDKLREWAANIAGPEVANRLNYVAPAIDDSAESKSVFLEATPIDPNSPHYMRLASDNADYIGIPSKDLPQLVANYVRELETKPTNEWCKCEWKIHPDDVNKAEGQRRIRQGSVSLDCPVHTREGFLLYFFTWVFKRTADATACDEEDKCVMNSMCAHFATCVEAERNAH